MPQKLEAYIAGLDISETQPWLLQQFIRGPEYACYSVVHAGNIVAHADNEAELSCLNYAHVGLPGARALLPQIAVADSSCTVACSPITVAPCANTAAAPLLNAALHVSARAQDLCRKCLVHKYTSMRSA